MLKKLVVAGFALSAFALSTQPASADAKVRGLKVDVPDNAQIVLTVTGTGNVYNHINGDSFEMPVYARAHVANGNLKYKIGLAHVVIPPPAGAVYDDPPAENYAQSFIVAHYFPRKFDQTKTMYLPKWILGKHRSRIHDVCNKLIAAGQSKNTDHLGQYTLPVKLRVRGGKAKKIGSTTPPVKKFATATASTEANLNIVCKALKPQTPHVAYKVLSVDLSLKTDPNDTFQPQPGLTCPVLHIIVRVTANKNGHASVDSIGQINGESSGGYSGVSIQTTQQADGSYAGETTNSIQLAPSQIKPSGTPVKFYARAKSGQITVSSPWKSGTIKCEGPGTGKSGGLTAGNDEPVHQDLKLTGDFSYADVGSPKCARKGEALISFKTNMPVDVHYKLDCSNGQSFSGVAKSVKLPQGGYVAAAMKSFNIDKTTVYSCALKSVQPGPVKLHKWKGHTFDCVHRGVETGSGDVQVAPKPSDGAPRTPAANVKVAPKPTDVDAGKKRREAREKAREAARKKAEAEKRRKAAEAAARARREAAKKAAEARRKREAAKKAAEARRKRAAAKKAAELRRKRKAAKAKRKRKRKAATRAAQ